MVKAAEPQDPPSPAQDVRLAFETDSNRWATLMLDSVSTPVVEIDTTRYDLIMTGLLEQALRRLEALSADEQDAIASQIIETLDDEKAWADRFATIPASLRNMAREAGEEHRRGETRPLDELIQ